jgi:hypothetical protein
MFRRRSLIGPQASRLPINRRRNMDTALVQIRAKISELETKIGDLRIAERELQAIDKAAARQTGAAPKPTLTSKAKPASKPKQTSGPKPKAKSEPETTAQTEPLQSMGAAIASVLDQHGALSAAEIAERVKATGRDVNNRAVSFALQALKKRGLAKNTDGKWTAPKTRGRRARPLSGAGAPEAEAAA